MKFIFRSLDKISQLPKVCGVYCFKDGKKIFYIGKAANLRERVKNHFQNPSFKDYLFLEKVKKIGYLKTDSEIEALILEANLIKKFQPKFNVLWKDDKNYFFVAKTIEDFPRIFWTHQRKLKIVNCKLKIDYVGPFVDGKALKETLKILRKVFPFRSCKNIPKRPCLWYHLGRCLGPCLLKSKFFDEIKERTKIGKIAKENAKFIFEILKEGKKKILKKLKKEMEKEALSQNFEEAARKRDQIKALEKILAHAKILEEVKIEEMPWLEIERKLKEILKFDQKITRIEAFDVSNIHGKLATGAMVTFLNGIPEKNLYRKFKIKFEKKPNDLSMLKEVLKRRFSHKEWGFPDLILIDGGKAHLNLAIECKKEIEKEKLIKAIALAKKEKKIFIEGEKRSLFLKNLPREIFNLILNLNNEAHRFAISYHQVLRKKTLLEIEK